MRYEIDKKNAIKIYNDGEEIPFLYQPDWPDGTKWANKEQAENWATVTIEAMQNPDSEFIAGVTPTEHPRLRPEPVDPETGLPIEPTEPAPEPEAEA